MVEKNIFYMIQSNSMPEVDLSKITPSEKGMFEALKGLSFDDAVEKIANSIVDFTFRLAIAIALFYLGRFIIRKTYKWIKNLMIKRNVDASLSTFVLSLIKITAYFLLVIIVIGILGIETSSFIALFASAGVAVGMALSGTLQNFAGGVLILLLKPFKVGNYIEAQGYAGTVKAINIFNTVINTPDNKSIIIPNGGLSTSSVNNYSLEEYRRVDWNIGLSYSTNFEDARKTILEMLAEDERVASDYKGNVPFVGLNELGDSSINLVVRAWTPSSKYWELYFDMNQRFFKELPEKGFSFPFPQLDVHLDKQ